MSLKTIRALLGVVGGLAAGYAVASLFLLTPADFGVAVAITSACVIGIGLIRAVQSDRERMRQYREQVWQRRDAGTYLLAGDVDDPPVWPRYEIRSGQFNLKPWPIGDDEVRR